MKVGHFAIMIFMIGDQMIVTIVNCSTVYACNCFCKLSKAHRPNFTLNVTQVNNVYRYIYVFFGSRMIIIDNSVYDNSNPRLMVLKRYDV